MIAVGLFAADRLLFGDPSGPPGAAVEVRIPDGASVERIGDILDTAGVVGNGRVWALKVRLHGDGGGLYLKVADRSVRHLTSDQAPALRSPKPIWICKK